MLLLRRNHSGNLVLNRLFVGAIKRIHLLDIKADTKRVGKSNNVQ